MRDENTKTAMIGIILMVLVGISLVQADDGGYKLLLLDGNGSAADEGPSLIEDDPRLEALREHIREVHGEDEELEEHLRWMEEHHQSMHPYDRDDLPCPMWQVDSAEEYEESGSWRGRRGHMMWG